LDIGQSCVRFTTIKEIPYNLVAELWAKMTVEEWIGIYEKQFKK
tara:strand:+ start:541 stop:672 length:132 start_codon:yes stop_codon:yes gene_type:complete